MIDSTVHDSPNETITNSIMWSVLHDPHLKTREGRELNTTVVGDKFGFVQNVIVEVEGETAKSPIYGVRIEVTSRSLEVEDSYGPTYVDEDEFDSLLDWFLRLEAGTDDMCGLQRGIQTRAGLTLLLVASGASHLIQIKLGSKERTLLTLKLSELSELKGAIIAAQKAVQRDRTARQAEVDRQRAEEERKRRNAELRAEIAREERRVKLEEERAEEERKKREARFKRTAEQLESSPAYELLRSYSVKFGFPEDSQRLESLRTLLAKKGFTFSDPEIRRLVNGQIELNRRREAELHKPAPPSQSPVERLEADLLAEGPSPVQQILMRLETASPREFEEIVAGLFERMGWEVKLTPETQDQGADLVLSREEVRVVVQAKMYKGTVGNGAVQEVVASKAYYKASRAIVVATGSFSKSAISLAETNGVELIDGMALRAFLAQYY